MLNWRFELSALATAIRELNIDNCNFCSGAHWPTTLMLLFHFIFFYFFFCVSNNNKSAMDSSYSICFSLYMDESELLTILNDMHISLHKTTIHYYFSSIFCIFFFSLLSHIQQLHRAHVGRSSFFRCITNAVSFQRWMTKLTHRVIFTYYGVHTIK